MSMYVFSSLGPSPLTGRPVDRTNRGLRQDLCSADFENMLRMEAARQPRHGLSSFLATGTMGREHHETRTADGKAINLDGTATPYGRATNPGDYATKVTPEAEDFTTRSSQTLHANGSGPASHNPTPQARASALHEGLTVGRAIAEPNRQPIAPTPTNALEMMPKGPRNSELLTCGTMQQAQRQTSSAPFGVSLQLADDHLQVRLSLHVSTPEERLRLRTAAAQLLADYNWPDADLHINEGRNAKTLYARKGVYVGG